MLIDFAMSHMSGVGGVETLLKSLVPGLEARGHRVRCWVPDASDTTEWEEASSVGRLDAISQRLNGDLLSRDVMWGYAVTLGDAWRTQGAPDVVIATAPYLCALARAAVGGLDPRPRIMSWVQVTLQAFRGVHGGLFFADSHIAISSGLRNELREVCPDAPIYLVPNGTDLNVPLMPRAEKPTFVYVGRLENAQKRVDRLLRALHPLRHKEWKLFIVGEGPDGENLKALSCELQLTDKVNWLGRRGSPFEAVGSATALVLPSEWEGFGMVLVEALARGIPVVASDCPVGPADIVNYGNNGWIFPRNDERALTILLEGIIDGGIPMPTARACRSSVGTYDSKMMVERFDEAIQLETH